MKNSKLMKIGGLIIGGIVIIGGIIIAVCLDGDMPDIDIPDLNLFDGADVPMDIDVDPESSSNFLLFVVELFANIGDFFVGIWHNEGKK